MGSVKIDLYSNDIKYKVYTLSDVKVVELLLRFRYKYDPYMYNRPNNNFAEAGDIEPMNAEAVALFQDLNMLIETAGLNERQMKIINLVQDGYELKQIAQALGVKSTSTISRTFQASCKKIVEQNLWNWRKTIFAHTLGLQSKKCSKCEEELPGTVEFYRDDSRNNDGFQSQCKKCEI